MLQALDDGPLTQTQLEHLVSQYLEAVLASRGHADVDQLERVEAEVAADPARALRFDATGRATLVAAGQRFQAGHFRVLRLCELRALAWAGRARASHRPAPPRLWVFDGAAPMTDIGALQAFAPPRSLFQVASQFNCLEAPGAFLTTVSDYLSDPTQGPRASVSAFPGTLLRHYAAPAADGRRFVQRTDAEQLDLLAEVCAPGVAAVRNGYLRASDIEDPETFARLLEERFEAISVGVHQDVEVVLGYDWSGGVAAAPHCVISQVFTSTIAGGMYSELAPDDAHARICRQLQRAAYLGTLLAAAALGQRRVVLTLIGGGVFANPIRTIWDALVWASDAVAPLLHDELTIIVNGRNLGQEIPHDELHAAACARGGSLIRFHRAGPQLGA